LILYTQITSNNYIRHPLDYSKLGNQTLKYAKTIERLAFGQVFCIFLINGSGNWYNFCKFRVFKKRSILIFFGKEFPQSYIYPK
jgi:hypothetical protein